MARYSAGGALPIRMVSGRGYLLTNKSFINTLPMQILYELIHLCPSRRARSKWRFPGRKARAVIPVEAPSVPGTERQLSFFLSPIFLLTRTRHTSVIMPPDTRTYLQRSAPREDVLNIQLRVANILNTRKQLDEAIAWTQKRRDQYGLLPMGSIEEYDDALHRTRVYDEFLEKTAPRLRKELEEVKKKAELISSEMKAIATAGLGIADIHFARKAVMEFLAETESSRGADEKYNVADPSQRDDGILRQNATVSVERLRTIMNDPFHSQWRMSVVLDRLSALHDNQESLRSEAALQKAASLETTNAHDEELGKEVKRADDAESKLGTAEEEILRLGQELEEAKAALQQRPSRTEWEVEKASLRGEHRTSLRLASDEHDRRLASARQEALDAQDRYVNQQTGLLRANLRQANADAKKAREQYETQRDRADRLQQSVSRLENEASTAAALSATGDTAKNQEIERLKTQMQQKDELASERYQSMQAAQTGLESITSTLTKAEEARDHHKAEAERLEREWQNDRTNRQTELDEVKAELRKAENQADSWNDSRRLLEEELSEAKTAGHNYLSQAERARAEKTAADQAHRQAVSKQIELEESNSRHLEALLEEQKDMKVLQDQVSAIDGHLQQITLLPSKPEDKVSTLVEAHGKLQQSHAQLTWTSGAVQQELNAIKAAISGDENAIDIQAFNMVEDLKAAKLDLEGQVQAAQERHGTEVQAILRALLPSLSSFVRRNWINCVGYLCDLSFDPDQERFPHPVNAPRRAWHWQISFSDASQTPSHLCTNPVHKLWLYACCAPGDLAQMQLLIERTSLSLDQTNAESWAYLAKAAERYTEVLEQSLDMQLPVHTITRMAYIACRILELALRVRAYLSKDVASSLRSRILTVKSKHCNDSVVLTTLLLWLKKMVGRKDGKDVGEFWNFPRRCELQLRQRGDCISEDMGPKDSQGRPLRSLGFDLDHFWVIDHTAHTMRTYDAASLSFRSGLGTQEIRFSESRSVSLESGMTEQPFIFAWGDAQDDFLGKHMTSHIMDEVERSFAEDDE